MNQQTFLDLLAGISLITSTDQLQKYSTDSSGYAPALPTVVIRPNTVEQVIQAVKACNQCNINYTVQGGLSGLAGGARPSEGEAVISLELLNKIEEIDTMGGTAIVQAGVILENVHHAVAEQGWYFPLDLGARGSCQIGGNVATNAGGNKVFRYGTTRELVLGLEVVLSDGTHLNMLNRVLKNNTGLDLKHLFIGTEGRYGIITRICLRLFPLPQARHTALVALKDFEALTRLLKQARANLAELASFEVMWDNYLMAAAKSSGKEVPFGGSYHICVLLEVEGADKPSLRNNFEEFLEQFLESGLLSDVILPQTLEQAAALWEIRDASSKAMHAIKPFVAFDIGMPLKHMEAFIAQILEQIKKQFPNAENQLFGHLGDGNLHLTTGHLSEAQLLPVEELVYQITAEYGGSITAEHGVGRIKKPFLHYSRSQEQMAIMQAIRQVLNPQDRQNSGRVID